MEENLSGNVRELKKINSNLIMNIQNDNQQINNNNNQNEINEYNINDFQKDITINKLMSINILLNIIFCQICKKMKLEKVASYQDGIIWRYRGNLPKHYIIIKKF